MKLWKFGNDKKSKPAAYNENGQLEGPIDQVNGENSDYADNWSEELNQEQSQPGLDEGSRQTKDALRDAYDRMADKYGHSAGRERLSEQQSTGSNDDELNDSANFQDDLDQWDEQNKSEERGKDDDDEVLDRLFDDISSHHGDLNEEETQSDQWSDELPENHQTEDRELYPASETEYDLLDDFEVPKDDDMRESFSLEGEEGEGEHIEQHSMNWFQPLEGVKKPRKRWFSPRSSKKATKEEEEISGFHGKSDGQKRFSRGKNNVEKSIASSERSGKSWFSFSAAKKDKKKDDVTFGRARDSVELPASIGQADDHIADAPAPNPKKEKKGWFSRSSAKKDDKKGDVTFGRARDSVELLPSAGQADEHIEDVPAPNPKKEKKGWFSRSSKNREQGVENNLSAFSGHSASQVEETHGQDDIAPSTGHRDSSRSWFKGVGKKTEKHDLAHKTGALYLEQKETQALVDELAQPAAEPELTEVRPELSKGKYLQHEAHLEEPDDAPVDDTPTQSSGRDKDNSLDISRHSELEGDHEEDEVRQMSSQHNSDGSENYNYIEFVPTGAARNQTDWHKTTERVALLNEMPDDEEALQFVEEHQNIDEFESHSYDSERREEEFDDELESAIARMNQLGAGELDFDDFDIQSEAEVEPEPEPELASEPKLEFEPALETKPEVKPHAKLQASETPIETETQQFERELKSSQPESGYEQISQSKTQDDVSGLYTEEKDSQPDPSPDDEVVAQTFDDTKSLYEDRSDQSDFMSRDEEEDQVWSQLGEIDKTSEEDTVATQSALDDAKAVQSLQPNEFPGHRHYATHDDFLEDVPDENLSQIEHQERSWDGDFIHGTGRNEYHDTFEDEGAEYFDLDEADEPLKAVQPQPVALTKQASKKDDRSSLLRWWRGSRKNRKENEKSATTRNVNPSRQISEEEKPKAQKLARTFTFWRRKKALKEAEHSSEISNQQRDIQSGELTDSVNGQTVAPINQAGKQKKRGYVSEIPHGVFQEASPADILKEPQRRKPASVPLTKRELNLMRKQRPLDFHRRPSLSNTLSSGVVILFLYLPLMGLLQGLFSFAVPDATPETPHSHFPALSKENLVDASLNTAIDVLASSIIAVLLACVLVIYLAFGQGKRRLKFIQGLFNLPSFLPVAFVSAVILLAFESNGFANPLVSVIVIHVLICLPLSFQIVSDYQKNLDHNILLVARDLYAEPQFIAFNLALPILKPAIFASMLICFAFVMTDVIAAFMVGSDQFYTLPLLLFYSMLAGGDWMTYVYVTLLGVAAASCAAASIGIASKRADRRQMPQRPWIENQCSL